MSGRTYISGALKRKISDEKKEKLEKQLRKIPKIDTLFSVAGPSSARNEIESETEGLKTSDVSEETMVEISDEAASPNLSIDDENYDEMFSNVSASSFAIEIENFSEPQFRFPTDVALWKIDSDLPDLQRYWARLGEHFFLI